MDGFGSILSIRSPWLGRVPQHHPEASARAVPAAHPGGQKLLMLTDGHLSREQALGFCSCRWHRRGSGLGGHQSETLRNMVAAGGGMTLVPRLAAPCQRRGGGRQPIAR